MTPDRRAFLAGSLALGASACIPLDQSPLGRLNTQLRIIEAAPGGTLGAEIFDTQTGESIGINSAMRFGHCSSFKLSLAATILARDAEGTASAEQRLAWTRADLLTNSPFTTERVDQGASLRELAEATQKVSDNTAANLLLRHLGGPAQLTAFWRGLGDTVSRLDRYEPELNNVPAGELRDTTTPQAMARTVARMLYGDALPQSVQTTLRQWMMDTQTGQRRVRAGLPRLWRAGDKTGTSTWPGMGSLYVDIGFVEPAGSAPVTFAAYYRAKDIHDAVDPASERVLAQVGATLTDFVRRSRAPVAPA